MLSVSRAFSTSFQSTPPAWGATIHLLLNEITQTNGLLAQPFMLCPFVIRVRQAGIAMGDRLAADAITATHDRWGIIDRVNKRQARHEWQMQVIPFPKPLLSRTCLTKIVHFCTFHRVKKLPVAQCGSSWRSHCARPPTPRTYTGKFIVDEYPGN